jgi:hypothetical protein
MCGRGVCVVDVDINITHRCSLFTVVLKRKFKKKGRNRRSTRCCLPIQMKTPGRRRRKPQLRAGDVLLFRVCLRHGGSYSEARAASVLGRRMHRITTRMSKSAAMARFQCPDAPCMSFQALVVVSKLWHCQRFPRALIGWFLHLRLPGSSRSGARLPQVYQLAMLTPWCLALVGAAGGRRALDSFVLIFIPALIASIAFLNVTVDKLLHCSFTCWQRSIYSLSSGCQIHETMQSVTMSR